MALPFLLILLLLPMLAEAQLSLDYYQKTCPDFSNIMRQVVTEKQLAAPTTAAGVLRVFFHDCVVGGCDASLLLSSNHLNNAERDNDINRSLPGDAFDLVIRAKTALELKCPGIVSCSDILAEATRDLIIMVGGPFFPVLLGRKDSQESKSSDVDGHIARANMSMTQIIGIFDEKRLTIQEMVALTGAHTIGFSHCSEFSHRIFDFSKTSQVDPSMNPRYAQGLRKLCANYKKDPSIAAFNDAITPGKFDNMYYVNLRRGLGLLASDHAMASDPRTKPFVELYAANQTAFFTAFSHAMEKLSVSNVKTGNKGEVRRRCDAPNGVQSNGMPTNVDTKY